MRIDSVVPLAVPLLWLLLWSEYGECFSTLKGKIDQSFKLSSSQADVPFRVKAADALISGLFTIKPLFKIASNKARQSMVQQGLRIGVDWAQNVRELESNENKLNQMFDNFNSKRAEYPDYYLKPFHAYEEGNLSWKAAMEVESAALTVHAPIFTENKSLSRDGDFTLRDRFHRNMKKVFAESQFKPSKILDIGCSTGLSTVKLHESFPDAEIIGLDLSPYFLAVAQYYLLTRPNLLEASKHISYIQGAGESTGLGLGDADLITMCLVSHELPGSASRAVFEEAYKILPKGGAFSFMDMNPNSPYFIKFASNPFAFSAFKSTEPWIREYVSMDLERTLTECGFERIAVLENSPRHRTVVAYK